MHRFEQISVSVFTVSEFLLFLLLATKTQHPGSGKNMTYHHPLPE